MQRTIASTFPKQQAFRVECSSRSLSRTFSSANKHVKSHLEKPTTRPGLVAKIPATILSPDAVIARYSSLNSLQSAPRQGANMQAEQDPRISEVLDFWFGLSPEVWFRGASKELDDKVREQFGALVATARTSELDTTWTTTPRGTLALIILLDQFPRNIFRGSGESFASDEHAAQLATRAVARSFDLEIMKGDPRPSIFYRYFFYLPLMHAEDLTAQVACTALIDGIVRDGPASDEEAGFMASAPQFARAHRDCVALLGRFPKRNAWLGRETTEQEKAFLEEHPAGF